ncbi:thioredoxin domain-containing protein [Candidatus Saccharibacteria bacterium]|nr:thioredoxin domain-containing protein [Candidatus Saccharibacteria bacterium]
MDDDQQQDVWDEMTEGSEQMQEQMPEQMSEQMSGQNEGPWGQELNSGNKNLLLTVVCGVLAIVAMVAATYFFFANPFEVADDKTGEKQGGSTSVEDKNGSGGSTEEPEPDPGDGATLPPLDNTKTYDTARVIAADGNNGYIGDHVLGNKNASVILIEYGDLQCPGCASITPSIYQLYKKYEEDIAFVFRHYIITGHEYARGAAMAAEAAGRQGKFWEMVETLYDNRGAWIGLDENDLLGTYQDLFKDIYFHADLEKFASDIGEERIERKINFDYKLGREKDKVSATPTFFVNGKMVDISKANTVNDVVTAVEAAIKSALGR